VLLAVTVVAFVKVWMREPDRNGPPLTLAPTSAAVKTALAEVTTPAAVQLASWSTRAFVCSTMALTAAHLYRLFEHNAEQFALVQMNIGREMSRRLRDADERLFQATMGAERSAPDTAFQTI